MFSSGLLVVQYKMIKAFVSEQFYKIKGTLCSSCALNVLYCVVLCERAHGSGRVHPSTVGKCDIVYKWDIECRSMYGLVCLCYA